MSTTQTDGSDRIIQDAIARKRRKKARTLLVVLFLISVCFVLWPRAASIPDYPAVLHSAYKVEVNRWTGPLVLLTADPSEITSWIPPGPWATKDSCACDYEMEIIFHTPRGIYSAMSSDHSLIVSRGQGDKRSMSVEYAPPPGFWEKYQAMLARAGIRTSDNTPPEPPPVRF